MNKRTTQFVGNLFLALLFGIAPAHLIGNQNPAARPRPTTRKKTNREKNKKRVPATFGKTHFIVGFPHESFNHEQRKQSDAKLSHLVTSNGIIKRALFSPDDNIKETLLNLIASEQNSIKIAIFSFTNADIAQALIKAAQGGISVEVITDPSCFRDPFTKIPLLNEQGVRVFVYKPIRSKSVLIDKMHDKFIIFGKNINDKSIISTGSFNFTKSASEHNQENVVILDDLAIIDQFNQQFSRLKQRSRRYSEA